MAQSIVIIKSDTAMSLSGRDLLSYDVAVDDRLDVCVRITGNTRSGKFNRRWIALKDIWAALAQAPSEDNVRAAHLAELLRGTSRNTAHFVLAILRHEKLVGRSPVHRRRYKRAAWNAVTAWANALTQEARANLAVA